MCGGRFVHRLWVCMGKLPHRGPWQPARHHPGSAGHTRVVSDSQKVSIDTVQAPAPGDLPPTSQTWLAGSSDTQAPPAPFFEIADDAGVA